MRSPIQQALDDATDDLSSSASIWFTPPTGSAFPAWPIEQPVEMDGRLLASPDAFNWYESKASPVFKNGDALRYGNKVFTVARRNPADPFSPTFKFAILPGRNA